MYFKIFNGLLQIGIPTAKKTKPTWKIHFPVSISVFCVGVFQVQVCLRATPRSESPGNKELQTENPQQPTEHAIDHPDIWIWRKQV